MANNPATSIISENVSSISTGMKTGIAIVAAFVIYLIAKNRLGIYLGLITG